MNRLLGSIATFLLLVPAANAGESSLAEILAGQPEEVQARYSSRHPAETLEFFEIEPGMTVVEALPGTGWYSKILLPYLGADGKLVGADYRKDMYELFGFFDEKFLTSRDTFVADWSAEAAGWSGDGGASTGAFVFGSMPASMKGTADAVLLIRALHNLARFDSKGGYLSMALKDTFDVLKPGGLVGVVQHRAPDSQSNEWADGSHGYLKRDFVVNKMTEAGFELVAESDINANPKDQPGDEDIVWRLPPTFATSGDNPELKAKMAAIGESNRMTLKFRKPK